MAGTKRRRTPTVKSSPSVPSPTDDNATSAPPSKKQAIKKTSSISKVLQRLLEISSNEARATGVLQALADPKITDNWDSYWILLATQVVHRLVTDQADTQVLAALCDLLSRVMTSDTAKLEKTMTVPAGRSSAARAVLAATMGALQCVTRSMPEELSPQRMSVLLAATAAMDRMVHLQPVPQDLPQVDWNTQQQNLDASCSLIPHKHEEDDLIDRLEQLQSTIVSPPIKPTARATRRKTTTIPKAVSPDIASLTQALEAMLGETANQRIDTRVVVKRWASTAIVWYGQGPRHLLKCVHQLAHEPHKNCFELSRLLCRLLAIVAESGTNCGLRPPGAAMDQYIASLDALQSSDEDRESTRVDIRDWVVVAIEDVLHVHRQCLVESNSPICNCDRDHDRDQSSLTPMSDLNPSIYTAPNLSVILHSLCRAAAASVADSGFSKQTESTKALVGIATALCFKLLADSDVPLDCRLGHFALSNFTDTLRQLDQQSPSSSVATGVDIEERDAILEKVFHLWKPLPQPLIPQDEATRDKMSTFPQGWAVRNEFTNEDILSWVLRGVRQFDNGDDQMILETSKHDENMTTAQSRLLTVLMDLARRAMDTRILPTLNTHTEPLNLDTKPKAKGERKRVAKTSGGRKTKQTKTANDQTSTKQDDRDTKVDYNRINDARAILAKDALIALRHCLIVQTIPSSVLARSIRDVLDLDHLKRLISLGNLLDQVLVKTRAGVSRFSSTIRLPENDTPTSEPLSPEHVCIHANEFTNFEKELWSAHISMCQVLGRGQTDYDGTVRIVLTEQQRKSVIQLIAGGRSTLWPLALPAAHHAFLQAHFTSAPVEAHENLAEQNLMTFFVKAIRKTLQSLDEMVSCKKDPHCLYLDDGTQLTYKDARTVLLAFARLSTDDQRKTLDSFTNLLLPTLKSIQNDMAKQKNFVNNEEACTFIARVIVLSSAMMSMLVFGKPLRQSLFAHAGPTTIQPPGFFSSNEWYHCERTFMGLWGDWECPAVPQINVAADPPNWALVTEKSIQNMRTSLELAFTIGFETARTDQCYLLFAAWNGLGKLYGEGGTERLKLNDSTSLQINADNYPKRILQLRDDVCMIQNELITMSKGQRTTPSTKLRSNLKSTLHRANILMGRLTESATTDEDVPMSLFCLLCALPTYISSSISAHTKPGNDFFSSELAKQSPRHDIRQRAYSCESERMNSDAESVDTDGGDYDCDVRVDAVSRLRECCDAFGAAPIHPDWLDVSCTFQEGIRASDAVDNAETALRMLNKLTTIAFEQYKKNFLEALRSYKSNSDEKGDLVALSIDLLPWNLHEPTFTSPLGPGTYSDDRDWKEDVGLLCDLPEGLLDLVMDDALVKNVETAKESWCPNAAQRIPGRLQDRKRPLAGWETSLPELRAGGEWELLLAEALIMACLDVKRFPDDTTEATLESVDDPSTRLLPSVDLNHNDERLQKGHRSLKLAQVWRCVIFTATSHMLPAAALLRMGINKIGRKPHPFSFHENSQDPYDVAPLCISERLSHTTQCSQLVHVTTQQSVALLSSLSAHGDDGLSNTCHAIASHLLVDTQAFCDMEALQCIRLVFKGLKTLLRLSGSIKDKESSMSVFPFVVERLLLILEDFSHIPADLEANKKQQSFARLLLYFGASVPNTVDTLVGDNIDIFELLKGKAPDDLAISLHWPKNETYLDGLDNLIAVLCGLPIHCNDRSRACAATILCNLVASERTNMTSSVLSFITSAFNNLTQDGVKNLIKDNLFFFDRSPNLLQQTSLSHLLQYMLSDGDHFCHSKLVYDVLFESFDEWRRSHATLSLDAAFDCLLTYGCKFNDLNRIGAKLLSLETPDQTAPSDCLVDLELVTKFLAFVKHLGDAVSRIEGSSKKEGAVEEQNTMDNAQESKATQSPLTLARRCSFVEKTGYHGQHWYNCYTCGLVWEKGCCTLCALVCHKGHDVSYSRYSSFFCDCAAEDGTSSSQNRVPCRCMIQLPAEDVNQLIEAETANINVTEYNVETEILGPSTNVLNIPSGSMEIALTSLGPSAKHSIANLSKSLATEAWFVALFHLIRQEFRSWKENKTPGSDILPLLDNFKHSRARPSYRTSPLVLRRRLRNRHSQPLELQHLSAKTMIPIRSAKGFQTRLSTDTSTNAHLLAKLSRNDITRCNLVADSRGRLVIAEPCSLVFCSTIPAVATRYVSRAHENPLPRQQMCILGSSSISFNIVGIRLCPENERHLIVWGVSEACVVIIKPHWDGAETKIDLMLDFEQADGDSDYLVKCDFVPGSQSSLVAGCGHFVRVFDITKSKDNRVSAVVAYNLGFEVSLRDIALVPVPPFDCRDDDADNTRRCKVGANARMFMLLENGRLHTFDLKTDSEGRIEPPSDEPCELSGSVSLPTAGVRPRTGSPLGVTGSTAKSLGEGSRIVYLQQSRILLYKCLSSCVIALMLDESGNVDGSFELIPHVLSSDILWNGIDGHSIVGPFNHWTELGVVYNDNGMYFRVACIGRSSRTNQPKVLCIEFNEKDVRVKELVWNSAGSISLSLSYEGLCAFSLPFVGDSQREYRAFGERAFLCTATSAGSILFFGEEVVDTVASVDQRVDQKITLISLSGVPSSHVKKPSFPLTIFERLKNVSECEAVVFTGDGTGCDPVDLKSKLLRDRSSSLVCHRREGCVLAISLRAPIQKKPSDDDENSEKTLDRSHAIVALRVLVGSNTSQVPSKVYIQGRPVDLTPRLKKWYSLPLTNEEITLGIRNGIISLGIGPPFDPSNSSSVDSVEVYVVEREKLAGWIQVSYIKSNGEQPTGSNDCAIGPQCEDDEDIASRGLLLSVRALTSLCEISSESLQRVSESQRSTLRTMVEETAFTRDKVVRDTVKDLLNKLEPNDRLRNSLYDESILRGCMKILGDAKVLFDDESMNDANENTRWDTTRSVLRDCLDTVSKIARERPMNYLQYMENASENDASIESIASDVSKLILEGARRSLPCSGLIDGPGGLVELCLTEIAIELNTERGKNLAKFEVIKEFLESGNCELVELTCQAVSDFCRRQVATNQCGGDLFRLLQGTRIVAYKCDSCGLCPLKDVRYTFLEESFDIDLCKECYTVAESFAEKNEFDANVEVTIDGSTVGAESKLTCSQLRQMHPVPLEKMDVEQVEVRSTNPQVMDVSPTDDDQNANLAQMNVVGTLSKYGVADSHDQVEPQAYEDFMSYLFSSILDVLSDFLENLEDWSRLVAPLLRLLLNLVRNSCDSNLKHDRARRFVRELSKGISSMLGRRSMDGSVLNAPEWVLISCIRAAQLLAFSDDKDATSFMEQFLSEDETRSKASIEVVCGVHGIPAVRRRSAKGKNKDRRFYVCGKDRGQRCNFFKWADDVDTKSHSNYQISSQMRDILRAFLWNRLVSNGLSLNELLCELLEEELFENTDDEADVLLSMTNHVHEKKTPISPLSSQFGKREVASYLADGVFCSREKMQGKFIIPGHRLDTHQKQLFLLDVHGSGDSKNCLLQACLGLLPLVADHKTEGVTRWFSLLCEIEISTAMSTEVRSLARKVLKVLCGKRRILYHSIKDHFSFGFQLQALYQNACPMLEAALLARERARVCSPQWITSTKLHWSTLSYGGLIGADEFVSGTDSPPSRLRCITKLLDGLWSVVKNGSDSWRQFCGQAALPPSHRFGRQAGSQMLGAEQHLRGSPQIVSLFWVACSLSGSCQIKVFRLIQMALAREKETRDKQESDGVTAVLSSQTEEDVVVAISGAHLAAPEKILLLGDKQLSIDDLAAFAFHFILGGKSTELRRVSLNIATKILSHICVTERNHLFKKLFSSRFYDFGYVGKASIEYLSLLQFLAQNLDSSFSLRHYGNLVQDSFKKQINAVKYGRSNADFVLIDSGSGKRRFDLSECSYCLEANAVPPTKHQPLERRDTVSAVGTLRGGYTSQSNSKQSSAAKIINLSTKKWHHEQVSPYARFRLDALKIASSSDEFSTFFALKHRVVVSDIFLSVNDPRGRFVKNINVYYSSRPAADAAELKSDDYVNQWQKCVTVCLPRGASRATASVLYPVVAANLKIEYADFYDRPGGSKASDGSLLVHCPRCTRVVTNAHGVCGNCGEVASQCRKCRHINYDRLDAFLCVECGYCASGSFTVEIMAAVASNSIAILSDKEYDRSIRILGAVNTICDEVKTALTRTFHLFEEKKKSSSLTNPSFNSDINRSLLGLPPILEGGKGRHGNNIDRIDKQGSVVRLAARPESSQPMSRSTVAADRTRSLLRLARQIRSESGSAWDRRRSGDMIIHHLGRGVAVDNIEDERDLIGLLDDGHGLEGAESLGRTIANVRVSQRSLANEQCPSDTKADSSEGNKKKPVNKMLEECQRLHMLTREAQRERQELKRRIGAWQRLNEGTMIDFGHSIQDNKKSDPCRCSVCGSVVASHLLCLWSHLFAVQPTEVQVDQGFVSLLLSDSSVVGKTLSDCMRDVVKDIATKSESGTKLVLKEIRKRLLATNDPVSAEILGKIMAVDDHFMPEEYSNLAMEVLARRPD